MNVSDISVSVVIPTYNRVEMLKLVLPSYLQSPSTAEVIVVDDGSEDGTPEFLAEYAAANSRVRHLRHPHNVGQTVAKNTGIQHVSSDLVFIGEDDLELADGHLDILIEHMFDTGADVIAGRRIWLRPGETAMQGLARADRNRKPPVNTMLLEVNSHARPVTDVEVPILQAAALMRTDVAYAVPFDPEFRSGNCWREETDFYLSLCERGYRLVFCPHAVSFHYARPTFQARQSGNRLLSDIRTLCAMYRNNRRMLEKHRDFIIERGYLIGGNITATAIIYFLIRAVWMFKSEAYKIWMSRRMS
ncbi:MAG: glycosyltransferase family 2 protein [Anaerolineae bacterium]